VSTLDQVCYCDSDSEDCNGMDFKISSPVPGLLNPSTKLISCDVVLTVPEFSFFVSQPGVCPTPLEVRVKGY
jgi:hypothetical protein